MILVVDADSATPPYEQLRQQIVALVAGAALEPGDRLPPIRQLANDLGLAGGTVARAYRELEADGVVVTRGRHGTIVAARDPHGPPADLLAAARRYADRARSVGSGLDEAVAALRAAFVSGSRP